jgi:hypothetical protein
VPSESTFSRSFDEFAASQLPERVHQSIIAQYLSDQLVGHISRDSTAILVREKPEKKEAQQKRNLKSVDAQKKGKSALKNRLG